MKEKIIAAIKAKFPALNLRKTRLDAIAAKLEAKVKDETEIDAAVTDFDSLFPFADIAKQDDKIAELENKLKAPSKPDPKPEPAPTPKEETKTDDPVLAMLQEIRNEQQAQKAELQGLKTEKVTGTRKSGYEALFTDVKDDKMKANKLAQFDRLSFKDDEDYNSFITSEKEYLDGLASESLKSGPTALGVSNTGQPNKELVDKIVENITN